MIGNTYIKNGKIHLDFMFGHNFLGKKSFEYPIGEKLLDFTAVKVSGLDSIFNTMIEYVLNSAEAIKIKSQTPFNYSKVFGKDDYFNNPYLYLYFNSFLRCITLALDNRAAAYDMVKGIVTHDNFLLPLISEAINPKLSGDHYKYFSDRLDVYSLDAKLIKEHGYQSDIFLFVLLKNTFVEDIKQRSYFAHNEVFTLFTYIEQESKLSRTQILYLMDAIRLFGKLPPYYTYTPKTFTLMLSIEEDLSSLPASQAMKKLLDEDIELIEKFEIENIDELIKFELTKIVTTDLSINRCENCGFYFIPKSRVDTKYCSRIAPNSKVPCKTAGAQKKYNQKRNNDPIKATYNQADKHFRYELSQNHITTPEFFVWSSHARVLLKKCQNGEITLEEFQKWLALDFDEAITNT